MIKGVIDARVVIGDPIDSSKEFTVRSTITPEYCHLTGVVTGFLGMPVSDVIITLNGIEEVTDKVGQYSFLEVPLGVYKLKVIAEPWYNVFEVEMSLTEEKVYTRDVSLSLKPIVKYGVPLAVVGGVGGAALVVKKK